jgi:hypothetical protein
MLVSRIITLAARAASISGQGQTLSQDVTQTAFDALNAMIGQWAAKRWLVYHLVDSTLNPCTGAVSYTVGPGGTFNLSARPTAIENAYVSMYYGTPQQIDTQLEIIKAREDYNQIALKSLSTFPSCIYYDNAFPIGAIYAWPVPTNLYALTITVKMPLPQFVNLSDDINLPAEYQEALVYSLAARLRVLYQLPVDAGVVALATAALGTLRAANAQVQRLKIPDAIGRGGRFNIYSGQ